MNKANGIRNIYTWKKKEIRIRGKSVQYLKMGIHAKAITTVYFNEYQFSLLL